LLSLKVKLLPSKTAGDSKNLETYKIY